MKRTKLSTNKLPAKTGPKSTLTNKIIEQCYKMALLGLTDRQMAVVLDINVNTLDHWKRVSKKFDERIKEGKVLADANVAQAWYQRAIGYTHDDIHIMTNHVVEYDEEGKPVRSYNKPLIIPIKKHYPPDPAAFIKWMALRQRENWAEVQRMEINQTINITKIDMSDMTTEELQLMEYIGLKQLSTPDARNN